LKSRFEGRRRRGRRKTQQQQEKPLRLPLFDVVDVDTREHTNHSPLAHFITFSVSFDLLSFLQPELVIAHGLHTRNDHALSLPGVESPYCVSFPSTRKESKGERAPNEEKRHRTTLLFFSTLLIPPSLFLRSLAAFHGQARKQELEER